MTYAYAVEGPVVPTSLPVSGADLVRRAASGDAEASAALLRTIRPGVVAVVRRILGGRPADADDAVQQTLVAFVRALPAYRGEADPAAYAKTIAVRSALAIRRGIHRASDRNESDCDASALKSDHPSPSDDATSERRRMLLRQLLAEIPTEQAEALAMRVVLGWSLDEIAAGASVPRNTVRSRIRLAKEALRKKIEARPDLYGALDPDA